MLGLACIFRDLTMSKQSKAKDKLKEMEVSEEQWEQFKKLTKSGSDNPLENDTNDMVMNRVQKGKEEERKKKKKNIFLITALTFFFFLFFLLLFDFLPVCVCVVVAQGGIGALVTLAKSPNETSSMREALSQAMSNIAIVPSARGLMIQQGCLQRKEFFENNYFEKKIL